ncbi:MAG TPA: hypothetical protein VEI98_06460 [Xanthobacteraceae bacterium]|nr:hypothetical protein [Xanthobacteraceae bacterium]
MAQASELYDLRLIRRKAVVSEIFAPFAIAHDEAAMSHDETMTSA